MLAFRVRILQDHRARPMLHDLSSCGLRNGAYPGTGSCLSKCFGFHVRSIDRYVEELELAVDGDDRRRKFAQRNNV